MSKSSHSSHSHTSQHDTKSQKFWRSFLAFMLFLSLAATSLFACMRITFISPQAMVNMFCDKDYITSLQADLKEYATDLCKASSVALDGVDKISYDAVYELERAYIAGLMGTTEEYTETTYIDFASSLSRQVAEKTEEANAEQGIAADPDAGDGIGEFTATLYNYMLSRVEFPFSEQLQTVVNIGGVASLAGAILFAAVSVMLGAIVISIGKKRYRAMRELVYAATAAALLDFSLIGGVKLVGLFKSLVIYPPYLADMVMVHINRCLISVSFAGLILLAVALTLVTIIWKMKRNNNA